MYRRNYGRRAVSVALACTMAGSLGACSPKREETQKAETVSESAGEETVLTASGYDSQYFDEEGNMKLPISDGTETYRIMWRKPSDDKGTLEDKYMLQQAMEATGIRLEIEEVPEQGWDEKVSVTFASGDLPDAFCGRITNLINFKDQCADITDLVPRYAPFMYDFLYNQQKNAFLAEAFDGLLYGLPGARITGVYPRFFWSINTTWLDRVGMEIPTTTDELYEVLKAFKEQDANGNGDPDDEIPYSFVGLGTSRGNTNGLYCFMNMFGMVNDGMSKAHEYIMLENGKVIFLPTDQRFYDMLQYLNKLYSEGLMDQDGMVQESTDRYAKGTADKIGFFNSAGLLTTVVGDQVGEQFEYILPPDSQYGSVIYQTDPAGELSAHTFTITNQCKSPEKLIMFCEYLNSTSDNRFLSRFGPEGAGWVMTEDGKAANATDFTGKSYANRNQATFTTSLFQIFPIMCTQEEEDRREYVTFSIAYNDVGRHLYGPDGGHDFKEGFPLGNDTVENASRRAEMFAEIDTYIQNFVAESVTVGIDDAKWEAHLDKCRKLGQEEYVASFQELYDRLK